MENEIYLIISNHHLYWKPKAQYEKLRQIYILFNNIYSMKKKINEERNQKYKIICQKIKELEPNEMFKINKLKQSPVLICGGKYI